MKEFLGISYKLGKSDNFDEYMKALGVGLVTRKMGNAVTPTVCLTEANGVYTFTTKSAFKTYSINFKPGVEFDEETVDGRQCKSIITFEGNKMIHLQKGAITTTIVREFSVDEMVATFTVGDVVSKRIYEKTE